MAGGTSTSSVTAAQASQTFKANIRSHAKLVEALRDSNSTPKSLLKLYRDTGLSDFHPITRDVLRQLDEFQDNPSIALLISQCPNPSGLKGPTAQAFDKLRRPGFMIIDTRNCLGRTGKGCPCIPLDCLPTLCDIIKSFIRLAQTKCTISAILMHGADVCSLIPTLSTLFDKTIFTYNDHIGYLRFLSPGARASRLLYGLASFFTSSPAECDQLVTSLTSLPALKKFGNHDALKGTDENYDPSVTAAALRSELDPTSDRFWVAEGSYSGSLEVVKRSISEIAKLGYAAGCGNPKYDAMRQTWRSAGGKATRDNKKGIYGRSAKQHREDSVKGGEACRDNKKGVHGRSAEQHREAGLKGGAAGRDSKTGVHDRSAEQHREDGAKGGEASRDNKKGVHGRSAEQHREDGLKGAAASARMNKAAHRNVHDLVQLVFYNGSRNKSLAESSVRQWLELGEDDRSWQAAGLAIDIECDGTSPHPALPDEHKFAYGAIIPTRQKCHKKKRGKVCRAKFSLKLGDKRLPLIIPQAVPNAFRIIKSIFDDDFSKGMRTLAWLKNHTLDLQDPEYIAYVSEPSSSTAKARSAMASASTPSSSLSKPASSSTSKRTRSDRSAAPASASARARSTSSFARRAAFPGAGHLLSSASASLPSAPASSQFIDLTGDSDEEESHKHKKPRRG